MFGKLVALLAQAKGAAAATVFIAGGVTATVAATNPEVQDSVSNVTTSISSTLSNVTQTSAKNCVNGEAKGGGQPEVVAQRNAADKLLRDAWNNDKHKLNDLRAGKDVDNKTANDIIKKYDGQLKDVLDQALNDVAALTLGRVGQFEESPDPTATATALPSASPAASPSPKPSCTPKPSGSSSPAAGTPATSPSASPSGSGEPAKGRVAVANRTTLNDAIKAIVDKAIKDMDQLVTDATKAMDEAKLAAPSQDPRGKPEDKGKPSDKPGNGNGNGNKPSGSPRS